MDCRNARTLGGWTRPLNWRGFWSVAIHVLCIVAGGLFAGTAEPTPLPLSTNATQPELIPIRRFIEEGKNWGENLLVRVRGTVTHTISDRTYFIQQDGAGVYVFHKPSPPFEVGDEVEVIGQPSLGGFEPTLQRCEARRLGPGHPPEPRPVSFSQARIGNGHMQLVRMQGYLTGQRLRGGQTLVLTPADGTNAFTVELEALGQNEPLAELRAGSLLQVTGVCMVRRDSAGRPAAFSMLVRTPKDVVVLKPPPWWTPEHTWRVFSLTALGLSAAFIWVWTLRRQVQRQTARIRQLNDDLELRVTQRTAELSAANQELEAFSFSVSHDLRAPLRHINGYLSLLMREKAVKSDLATRGLVDQISHSASDMGRLIDGLLDLARIGRASLSRAPVALAPLVADVVQRLQPDLAGREVEWRIAPLPEVRGDAALLRVVWSNLLSNAIKYTRRRPHAVIEVNVTPGEKDWMFCVRDNGAGFDMSQSEHLFGVFRRLHRDEDFEGTGIGLASVRRVIERHGGKIRAEAQVDQGASFYFTLPK